jgi:hypothetical protein
LLEALRKEREEVERQTLKLLATSGGTEVSKLDRKAREAEKRAAKAQREAKRDAAAERSRTAAGFGGLRLGWNVGAPEVVPGEAEIAEQEKQARSKAKR